MTGFLPPTDLFWAERAALAALASVLDRLDAGGRLSDEEHAQAIAWLLRIKTTLNSTHVRRGGRILLRRRAKTQRELEVLATIRRPKEVIS